MYLYNEIFKHIKLAKISTKNDKTVYDYIYIDDAETGTYQKVTAATNYALCNKVYQYHNDSYKSRTMYYSGLKPTSPYILRDGNKYVNDSGLVVEKSADENEDKQYLNAGCKVSLQLKLDKKSDIGFILKHFKYAAIVPKKNNILSFGGYFADIDDKKLIKLLEKSYKHNELILSGKEYSRVINSYFDDNFKIEPLKEYNFIGRKFVRSIAYTSQDSTQLSNGRLIHKSLFSKPQIVWHIIQPIDFEILNWNDMPHIINPNGNGTAKSVELRSVSIVLGKMPKFEKWSDSFVREFLNNQFLKEAFITTEKEKTIGSISIK